MSLWKGCQIVRAEEGSQVVRTEEGREGWPGSGSSGAWPVDEGREGVPDSEIEC